MSVQRGIVIGGGAFAGLALALALRQGLGPELPIIVADPALGTRPSRDPRATAIVAACRRLFETIGVWGDVASGAQPILDMVVTDSKLDDATRPTFLTFSGHVEPGEPFAHMIENRFLIDALVERAVAEKIDLRGLAVSDFATRSDGVAVTLSDGSIIEASLLVAADGARSKLRERAGIATHGWDYDQSGIVVTVAHERDHQGRAEEHFLPAGPFAILPLSGKRSSLVLPIFAPSAVVISGVVTPNSSAPSMRRPSSMPLTIFPHWSDPPIWARQPTRRDSSRKS
jgi:2-octaprenyl-6-methoxyphenol hydroxylase